MLKCMAFCESINFEKKKKRGVGSERLESYWLEYWFIPERILAACTAKNMRPERSKYL